MFEIILACSALAVISWKSDVFSASASLLAFIIGVVIWGMNGFRWLFLLLAFMFIGYAGTKWKFDQKKEKGFEESPSGQRSIENVLGNGISPTFFALLMNPAAFSGAVSAALSDTLASEIGVLSDETRLITTFESVEPGAEGGVSLLGTLFSALGASTVAILSYLIFSLNPLIPFLGGFLACQIDSLLGATFERKGHLSKSMVNLIATFSGGTISLFIASI